MCVMISISRNDSRQLPRKQRFTLINRDTVWTQHPHVRLWYVCNNECGNHQCGVYKLATNNRVLICLRRRSIHFQEKQNVAV